jgi:hypothetical protein
MPVISFDFHDPHLHLISWEYQSRAGAQREVDMGSQSRRIGASAAALGLALGVSAAWTMAIPPEHGTISTHFTVGAGPAAGTPRPVGAGSCAARACHGSTDAFFFSADTYRGAYATWATSDPHARAYDVLTGDRSTGIINRLRAHAPKSWATSADKEARCLACHATPPGGLAVESHQAQAILRDGVGCEACHGPAERWLVAHTLNSWPSDQTGDAFRRGTGMQMTEHLVDRARVCVGCHVGAPATPDGLPARDVNHDLIAAGHPRLAFELAAFLDRMPRHWVEKGPPAWRPASSREPAPPSSDFRIRAWAIGQVVTAGAAAELLADRAERSSPQLSQPASWPEFAEYDCFGCHFQLGPNRREHAPGRQAADIGLPAWGSWTTPMLTALASQSSGLEAPRLRGALDELGKSMRLTSADPKTAARGAQALTIILDTWLKTFTDPPPSPEGRLLADQALLPILNQHRSDGRRWNAWGWDHTTQLYLALRAFDRPSAHPWNDAVPGDAQLDADLAALRESLMFAPGRDSPGDFGTRPPDPEPATGRGAGR